MAVCTGEAASCPHLSGSGVVSCVEAAVGQPQVRLGTASPRATNELQEQDVAMVTSKQPGDIAHSRGVPTLFPRISSLPPAA